MSTENKKGPSKLETLMGGNEIAVVLLDTGSERVKVRQLAVKYLPELLRIESSLPFDEIAEVCLLTGKETDWAERLAPESHEAIINEGEKLNRDFFGRWVSRQPKRESHELAILEAITKNPVLAEAMAKYMARQSTEPPPPPSPTLSSRPRSNPG